MPRPGPRPYECVRRAWHSDRHQPIRGSLIQEIFRVVNEVHSSATKKNKEWQEKLPVVVLKAEEIMYSKANSEAEYMDLKTLWDRTNDAINTIIRRDESTETGDLLQPCIEAALILGCTPRRTSRSQRNCHPRCYLSPGNQEPNTFCPSIANNIIQANSTTSPQSRPDLPNIIKPTVANSTHSGSQLHNLFCHNMSVTSNKLLFPTDNGHLSNCNQCLPMENFPVSSLWSVFPLYYGTCLESQHGLGTIPKSVPSAVEPVNVGMEQSLFPCNSVASVEINQTESKGCLIDQHDIGCDLSLMLGSLSAPLPSLHNRQLEYGVDVSYGCSQEGSKFNKQMPQKDKEFSFFTTVKRDNPLDSCSTKLSEQATVGALTKKRKAVLGHLVDNEAYYWQPKFPCNDLRG